MNGSEDEQQHRYPPEECPGFFRIILRERGCLVTLVVSLLLSLGIGSVIGLIPDTVADRYARTRHDYVGDRCSLFDRIHKPKECQEGSDDAQFAATWSNVGLNLVSFVVNPVMGSVSDAHGRRGMILLSLVLAVIPSIVFLQLVRTPTLPPVWYYVANATGGSNYFIGVAFATLSDVVPNKFRSSGYGLLLACFYGGFALGPSLNTFFSRDGVAVASAALAATALLVALCFLPETLPEDVRDENQLRSRDEDKSHNVWGVVTRVLARPIRDISILNQDWVMRLVAIGSFFSSMVYASDVTLVVYYIEDQLNVTVTDLAHMFLTFGLIGIVLQGGLIQPLVHAFGGEKDLLVATFLCGAIHNSLYGMARGQGTLLVALILAQFTKLNFPILSSLASQGASPHDQGRIQGALFASNALASAFGPLSMEYVYSQTKNCRWGPGTMFYYAALLQLVGTAVVSYIPMNRDAEEGPEQNAAAAEPILDLEEPLLSNTSLD